MIEVKVKYFGAFKRLGSELNVNLVSECSVGEFRRHLSEEIKLHDPQAMEAALVSDSVFADESHILSDEARISKSMTLSVLPPVCGG
ncbi:hypothetical protein WDW86_08665 [Bdellovibrionota bacterium FG-2]